MVVIKMEKDDIIEAEVNSRILKEAIILPDRKRRSQSKMFFDSKPRELVVVFFFIYAFILKIK